MFVLLLFAQDCAKTLLDNKQNIACCNLYITKVFEKHTFIVNFDSFVVFHETS